MHSIVGAILNVIIANAALVVDEVIMIQTKIIHGIRVAATNFWYIPDPRITWEELYEKVTND
jgi:hypothetical protein